MTSAVKLESPDEIAARIEALFAEAEDHAGGMAGFAAAFAPLTDHERLIWREALVASLGDQLAARPQMLDDWMKSLLLYGPELGRAADGIRLLDGGREPGLEAFEDRLGRLLATHLAILAPQDRARCFAEALEGLAGAKEDISLACAVFRSLSAEGGEEAVSDRREDCFGTATQVLRDSLYDRIQGLARSGALWSQASPATLLWFWFSCGQEQEVYQFTQKAMRDPAFAARLFAVPVDRLLSDGAIHEVVLARRWSKLLDLHGLEKPALDAALQGATRDIRKSARRFLDAFANGKSDLYR